MKTEQSADDGTVYTSKEEAAAKTCIDSLGDDAHYRFSCRCGCGAEFAGYGGDIKAASKVGREFTPVPVCAPFVDFPGQTTNSGSLVVNGTAVKSLTLPSSTIVEAVNGLAPGDGDVSQSEKPTIYMTSEAYNDMTALWGSKILDGETVVITDGPATTEASESQGVGTEKSRPYVSDRFVMKAQFGLSDDEIDAHQEGRPDSLEAQGYSLADRQPPGIGDLAYSLSTGDGPYSVIDYAQRELGVAGGGKVRTLCAILRDSRGHYQSAPLADLALHWAGRPKPRSSILVPLVLAFASIASAAIGSAAVVGAFAYFGL